MQAWQNSRINPDSTRDVAAGEEAGQRTSAVDTTHIFLTFGVGQHEYGLDVQHVLEITGLQRITPVPDMPEYVRGLTNLRGKVIPLVDMRQRFGLSRTEIGERTCAVVVQSGSISVGLIVDSVNEVLRLPGNQVEAAPQYSSAPEMRYAGQIAKVSDTVKLILDLNALLADTEVARIRREVAGESRT